MITSVIIPCWINDEEVWKVTYDCIESFKSADGNPIELILIDNGSKIGSGYMRNEASLYLRFPTNVGYTIAINYGIKVATGDVIALANNDIRVPPNWESVCRAIFADDPSIATIHPKMLDYDQPFEFGNLIAPTGMERWCGNSFVITSKEFLEVLRDEEKSREPFPGLFDEYFGIGGGADDWDFYFRVRKIGKTCYTNKTAFQHQHSFSLKKLGGKREEIVKQNNNYFIKKWGKGKEELFTEQFPEQMKVDWKAGFI